MSSLKELKKILNPQDLTFIDLTTFDDFSGLQDFRNLVEVKMTKTRMQSLPFDLKDLKKLEKLILCHNTLQEICELPRSIQFCDFSHNHLTILRFGRLKYLQELDLSHNRISNIDALSSLRALTYLYLSNNQVSCIEALSDLGILELDISNNLIQTYTAFSAVFPSVQILKISGNPCTKSTLPSFFQNFTLHPEHLFSRKSLKIAKSKLLKTLVMTKSIKLSKSTIIQKLSTELSGLKTRNKSLIKKVEKLEKTEQVNRLKNNEKLEISFKPNVLNELQRMSYEDWLSSLTRYQFLHSLYSGSSIPKLRSSGKRLVSKHSKLLQGFSRIFNDL
jgi:hypothetical protein